MIFVFVLTGFGCGQSALDRAIQEAVDADLEAKRLEMERGTITIEGENGETVSVGENVRIPENFPTDIPAYPGSQKTAYSLADEGAWLTLTTTDSTSVVSEWYAKEFSLWTKTLDVDYGGAVTQTYSKDGVQMTVSITMQNDITLITLLRQ